MLFVSCSCNSVYKHSIKLFPFSSLTSASGMGGFCPDEKTMRAVLTWACHCWRRRGRQLGWPVETIFLLFNLPKSFPFVLPLVFVIVDALEDDDDGDGGLAY